MKEKFKNIPILYFIILAIIILVLCCAVTYFMATNLISRVNKDYAEVHPTINVLCGENVDIEKVYNERFTDTFKETNSVSEFENFYDSNIDFFSRCDFASDNVLDLFTSGKASYVTFSTYLAGDKEYKFVITQNNKTLVANGLKIDGVWLINELKIK